MTDGQEHEGSIIVNKEMQEAAGFQGGTLRLISDLDCDDSNDLKSVWA